MLPLSSSSSSALPTKSSRGPPLLPPRDYWQLGVEAASDEGADDLALIGRRNAASSNASHAQ